MSRDFKGRAYHHKKIEVHLNFYIYDILDFDIFLGYPMDKFLRSHQGSLDENLRETDSATTTSCS